jgi:hypothetical protein
MGIRLASTVAWLADRLSGDFPSFIPVVFHFSLKKQKLLEKIKFSN